MPLLDLALGVIILITKVDALVLLECVLECDIEEQECLSRKRKRRGDQKDAVNMSGNHCGVLLKKMEM
ncbi:hypothetical protein MHBO_002782 [Bonamia ostreae]|uniref:Secreted protein n=1 Tax=Bonamia ostreae TaxID=126728 RepID=A0ABV2ANY1_9EUKA